MWHVACVAVCVCAPRLLPCDDDDDDATATAVLLLCLPASTCFSFATGAVIFESFAYMYMHVYCTRCGMCLLYRLFINLLYLKMT